MFVVNSRGLMVGELVVEEKWWMISGSDGINDLGLMDGCVCGGQ